LAAVCARISLPLYFTPVPLSLAPFAVLILGLLLSPRMAAASSAPTWPRGIGSTSLRASPLVPGGLAHLFGPTGGYLLAYPLAAALISFLFRHSTRGFSAALISAAAADLAILVCGGLWLAVLTHASVQSVLTLAVLPFLAGDTLKVAAAGALAIGLNACAAQYLAALRNCCCLCLERIFPRDRPETSNRQPRRDARDLHRHSPDSDDAFMFYGLATNKVRVPGFRFTHTLCDIETSTGAPATKLFTT